MRCRWTFPTTCLYLCLCLAGLALAPDTANAQQDRPVISPGVKAKLPPAAQLPAGVVTMRVPIARGAPGIDPATVPDPPPPLDARQRGELARAAGPRAAPVAGPAPETVNRPAEYTLTPQQPYRVNAGWIGLGDVMGYHSDSARSFNRGQGWVAFEPEGTIALTYHAEAGHRYLLDFALSQVMLAPYRISTAAGDREQRFSEPSHHLVLLTEPAEASGWGTVTVRLADPAAAFTGFSIPSPDDIDWLVAAIAERGYWTLYDVTVTRLD